MTRMVGELTERNLQTQAQMLHCDAGADSQNRDVHALGKSVAYTLSSNDSRALNWIKLMPLDSRPPASISFPSY